MYSFARWRNMTNVPWSLSQGTLKVPSIITSMGIDSVQTWNFPDIGQAILAASIEIAKFHLYSEKLGR
jgi:hypothetical protein